MTIANSVVVLAVVFLAFFTATKHDPALSGVSAFADDPYDAVSSFGVQVSLLTSLLSLFRDLIARRQGDQSQTRRVLVLRGQVVAVLSVAVSLAADLIAMFRFPGIWLGYDAGLALGGLLAAMALTTIVIASKLVRSMATLSVTRPHARRGTAILISFLTLVVLSIYPVAWHDGIIGALLTAALGIPLLFCPAAVAAYAVCPVLEGPFEDILDDAAFVGCRWRKRLRGPRSAAAGPQKVSDRSVLRWVVDHMNPRIHPRLPIVVLAACAGFAVMVIQWIGEGVPTDSQRGWFVLATFFSLESAGALFGYLMLGKFLGIFRTE